MIYKTEGAFIVLRNYKYQHMKNYHWQICSIPGRQNPKHSAKKENY